MPICQTDLKSNFMKFKKGSQADEGWDGDKHGEGAVGTPLIHG